MAKLVKWAPNACWRSEAHSHSQPRLFDMCQSAGLSCTCLHSQHFQLRGDLAPARPHCAEAATCLKRGSKPVIAATCFCWTDGLCNLQMLFTCVSMVLSLTIFAYILGEISNLVMDQDAELVKTRTQVRMLLKISRCAVCHTPARTHHLLQQLWHVLKQSMVKHCCAPHEQAFCGQVDRIAFIAIGGIGGGGRLFVSLSSAMLLVYPASTQRLGINTIKTCYAHLAPSKVNPNMFQKDSMRSA